MKVSVSPAARHDRDGYDTVCGPGPMSSQPRPSRPRRGLMAGPVVALLLVIGVGTASPAWADGGETANQGYVMIQGAQSYLIDDPGPSGQKSALAMIDSALAAKDQDGVDIAQVTNARTALKAGQVGQARQLLQDSIASAVAGLKPATGEETGTKVVLPPLATRQPVVGFDWLFLVVSALAALVGVALTYLFRPREGLREIREDILTTTPHPVAAAGLTSRKDGHDGR